MGNQKRTLRPCDCRSIGEARYLESQGIANNDQSLAVEPNHVILKIDHTTINIGMKTFQMFAEWYLKEQEMRETPTNANYFEK